MNIYIVKKYEDLNNNFRGIDDFTNKVFNSLEEAKSFLKEQYDKELAEFMTDKDVTEDMLNIELNEERFHINNDCDYVTFEIETHSLDVDVFAVTTISVDPYEPTAVTTYFRKSLGEAHDEYEQLKDDFFEEIMSSVEDCDMSDEEVEEYMDKFKCENIKHDYNFANGNRYFHCVYDEGLERVISIERGEA